MVSVHWERMRLIKFLLPLVLFCFVSQAASHATARREALGGVLGTYDGEPRLKNGHVDLDTLLSELNELKANSYNWLLWHAETDWDDLHEFLPRAAKQNIKVWVTVVPPTESSPKYHDAMPFRQDYGKWAEEIAKLSLREKNLVAWSIDDFWANSKKTFTPDAFKKIIEQGRKVNPNLAFIPCLYYRDYKPVFWTQYKELFDGVLFPYKAESGAHNLIDASLVESEVATIRALIGEDIPVIVDVYASVHMRFPDQSSPKYTAEVIERARRSADGVMIYCHQGKARTPEKFAIIKEQFALGLEKPVKKKSAAYPILSTPRQSGSMVLKKTFSRHDVGRGVIGTYGAPSRLPDGHADLQKLLTELEDIHANTYHWAFHSYTNDWEEIQRFLPLARAKKINVWITLMPPTESPPKSSLYSEPFRLDYERWAVEMAKLSLKEPNLVAWSVDDFTWNLKLFTPEYLGKVVVASHTINPKLAFIPCCYFTKTDASFAKSYGPLLDGVLFPYRDESGGANLTNPNHVTREVETLRDLFGPDMPIILDVYASAHSRLGATTTDYVEKAVGNGMTSADGVLIYKHQDPQTNAEKYQVIKRLFSGR
ncbi:MAG: hypothetical protein JWM68_912 [Verrucomicrobiales bacterium]|nr:hypothetical protein [Verrucomicrobiales bacterium]